VQARRNETPDLPEHIGEREDEPGYERHHEVGEELPAHTDILQGEDQFGRAQGITQADPIAQPAEATVGDEGR
jgi:hypothetical protein